MSTSSLRAPAVSAPAVPTAQVLRELVAAMPIVIFVKALRSAFFAR